jgi:hypothetical protein
VENARVVAFNRLAPRAAHALKFVGLLVAALIVVAVVAVAAIVLWLRTYTPLDTVEGGFAPGPGVGAVIEPAIGSGGKTVFFPAYRKGSPFVASFTLHNSGHFTVTVEGLSAADPESPPWIGPQSLLTTDSVSTTAPVSHTGPFQPLSLSPGDSAVLVVSFRLTCPKRQGREPSVYSDSVRLRYRYLRWFERTQTVTLPFAATLRCVGGPLATP